MLLIRSADISDIDILRKMGVEIFYETFAAMNTVEDMDIYLRKTFSQEAIQNELSHTDIQFFLAFTDDEPVGYAKISFGDRREEFAGKKQMEIERLYVYGKYQGRKIGYRLIRKCIDFARENGCQLIWLGVWEHNPKAIAFYEKIGFSEFGRHGFQLGHDLQTDHLLKLNL